MQRDEVDRTRYRCWCEKHNGAYLNGDTCMTKLDDLELKTISGNAIPVERVSLQVDELRWLIARVRTLETALTETQRNLRQLRKAQIAHVRLGLPMIDECITEALKEG